MTKRKRTKKRRATPVVESDRWHFEPRLARELIRQRCPKLLRMLEGYAPLGWVGAARHHSESGHTSVALFVGRNRLDLFASAAYLGGQISSRTPRKGETWLRGNDLYDGPMTAETLRAIMRDFLWYSWGQPTAADRKRLAR